ncbi:LysR substrate-binding domain-containing protein [Myxococcus sp. K15C18031901]|uniref:LysR substrate-binding domain-containing protein n=1 Tax=Myxococcus dinghuensis TaxID=2906761 RepID=UPI0020A7FA5C|nr:LysR substrate-binding domain-containing protein [Myxococcus dinghuensis]MCP3097401.1 LysR substrate-binding domain-containing protein [Myxococcus dinghuensis]
MPIPSDWLPALAAFESAARHQNFARAAEELRLTASAVSHHVRKLESLLGTALFTRHARGVALTHEGRQLADTAGKALADVGDVLRALGDVQTERNLVRVTTLHSLAYTWLLPRLPSFTAAHPHVRLRIDSEQALTRFDESGPDLGIRLGQGPWPGLTAHHLMDETLFPVASPRMVGLDAVRAPADIARLPLVEDLARQGWQDWFRAAGLHGLHLDVRHTFSDTTSALMAAVLGLGVALAREQLTAPYFAQGSLVRLPGPALPGRTGYYVVYPAHRRPRPAARAFIDWLLDQPRHPAPPPP